MWRKDASLMTATPENLSHDPFPPEKDAEWLTTIDAARNGSSDAFAEIVRNYWDYLNVVARGQISDGLKTKVGASDLVQQTLMIAFQDLSRFQGQTQQDLLNWLIRILKNQVATAGRTFRGTQKRSLAREIRQDQLSTDWHEAGSANQPLSASQMLVSKEVTERVELALQKLPQHYAAVIRRHNFERKSFEEIGTEFGKSPAAIRKIWVRALLQLRIKLSYEQNSDGRGTDPARIRTDVRNPPDSV